jgi:TatD DNase family protein
MQQNSENIFIDSHCHLFFSKFVERDSGFDEHFRDRYAIQEIIKRANDCSVKYILAIGTELSDIDEIGNIAENNAGVFRTIGIHPLEAQNHCEMYSMNDTSQIMLECNDRKLIGIGEIGLDYHYDKDDKKNQRNIFELQLELAKRRGLPLCIHSRDAEEDTIDVLKNHPEIKGVIHCFSGSRDFAFRAMDLGFYISVSGVITFKNAKNLQETIKAIPLNKLLIETDAPFLAPMPFRGKINEPAFVVHTAKKLSELLERPLEEISQKTTQNFFDLYTTASL